jgi:chromosomal replication initiation ATPase DnaA
MGLWLARRYRGLTLAELGDGLGGIDYAAVSVALRRHENRLQQDRDLTRTYEAAANMLNV